MWREHAVLRYISDKLSLHCVTFEFPGWVIISVYDTILL